jgi:fructan beta-fructosidase
MMKRKANRTKTIAFYGLIFVLTLQPVAGLAETEKGNPFDNFHTYLDVGYDQPYRPLFHFTSRKNWINDPNGLLYYDGEYHLFFQHNPLGGEWGNMTWGHAISSDLVRWEQRPHAITPYGNGYIFSGTGVVDHNNSLGVQEGDTRTLVLMFSHAVDERAHFGILDPPEETRYDQALAYSTDRGRTFKLWNDGKPVIPNQGREIDPKGTQRDPKLFWHEESGKWIAVLWMGESSGGQVRFFSSDDLAHWEVESTIQRRWAHECFELFELPVLDAEGNLPASPGTQWVMFDGNLDYEVGHFDGKTFTAGQEVRNHKLGHWNAAQTFNNMPDGRRVIIGWLKESNFWKKKMPFTEQLSFPATMHLRDTGDGYQIYRWPVEEIETLYGRKWELPADSSVAEVNRELAQIDVEASDITIEFTPGPGKDLVWNLRGSTLTYRADKKDLHFISKTNQERRPAWDNLTGEEKKDRKNWRLRYDQYVLPDAVNADGTVRLRILIDRASFEIFLNEGVSVLTHSEIHELDNRRLSIESDEAIIHRMIVHEVNTSWE